MYLSSYLAAASPSVISTLYLIMFKAILINLSYLIVKDSGYHISFFLLAHTGSVRSTLLLHSFPLTAVSKKFSAWMAVPYFIYV
jgi:hypothetical protein